MKVRITLTEDMLGTVPKDKEVYKTYIETKKPEDNMENESQTVEEIEEKGWTGFMSDEKGLFVWDYFVKGFLKHAGNVLKETVKIKALRSKIDDFVFVFPRRIYFGKKQVDGEVYFPLKMPDGVIDRGCEHAWCGSVYEKGTKIEPDGVFERPLRAQTMQGPRVTLARSDYISAGTQFEFEIKLYPPHKAINEELIKTLLDYGQYMGFGQFRNGSFGRFSYEIMA